MSRQPRRFTPSSDARSPRDESNRAIILTEPTKKRFWHKAESELDMYNVQNDMLNRNSRWAEIADTKAAAVLLFVGAILRTLIEPVIDAASKLPIGGASVADWTLHLLFPALTTSTLLVMLAAVFHAFKTLVPRVERPARQGLMFFGDIATRDVESWRNRMTDLRPADLVEDVLNQVYATSQVAHSNHEHARPAITSVFVPIGLAPALYLLSATV